MEYSLIKNWVPGIEGLASSIVEANKLYLLKGVMYWRINGVDTLEEATEVLDIWASVIPYVITFEYYIEEETVEVDVFLKGMACIAYDPEQSPSYAIDAGFLLSTSHTVNALMVGLDMGQQLGINGTIYDWYSSVTPWYESLPLIGGIALGSIILFSRLLNK